MILAPIHPCAVGRVIVEKGYVMAANFLLSALLGRRVKKVNR